MNVSGGLLNLRAFKSLPYTLYTASGFIAFLGLYTGGCTSKRVNRQGAYACIVLTYIDVSAALDGIDENFAAYLVSIANACSLFGRLGSGFLADKLGPS